MKICPVLAVLPFRSLLCLCKMKFHISRAEVCLNCSKNKAPIIFGINFFYKPALTRFMLCVFAIETKRKHWDGIFALFFCSSCDSYVKNKLFESLLIYPPLPFLYVWLECCPTLFIKKEINKQIHMCAYVHVELVRFLEVVT